MNQTNVVFPHQCIIIKDIVKLLALNSQKPKQPHLKYKQHPH